VGILLSGFLGALLVFLLGWVREIWRNSRERRGIFRLLLSELEHNAEMLQISEETGQGLAFGEPLLNTATWHKNRARAAQLLGPDLLADLGHYYGALEMMQTLFRYPGRDQERLERMTRKMLGELLGKEFPRSRDPWNDYQKALTESEAKLREQLRLASEGTNLRSRWRRIFGG